MSCHVFAIGRLNEFMATHVVNHCCSTRALFFVVETMDSYNEESEADSELKSDAKDVLNVCSTGKNQVKVQCDRKKKKSAANSKVFCVCMLCVQVVSGILERMRGLFFAPLGNIW